MFIAELTEGCYLASLNSLGCPKDLLGIVMDLDDDISYNFTDSTSQLMRDDGVIPWKGLQENIHCFFKF